MKRLKKDLQEQTGRILKKLLRKGSEKAGLPPGTVVHVGRKKVEKAQLQLIDFHGDKLVEKNLSTVDEALPFKEQPTTTWLNIIGLHETEHIVKLGEYFDLHPLIQEDIANTSQRPSFDDFQKYFFISLKLLSVSNTNGQTDISAEQVSFVVGSNYVLSFQETPSELFEGVKKRIRENRKITTKGSDYLAYALLDATVDQYFVVLEHIGDKIELIEEELNTSPSETTLQQITALKRELIFIRKLVWPLRESLSQLKKSDSKLIKKETVIFLNDVYDHTIQIIDTIESLRDIVMSMNDVYLSVISNRMNEIMKVLTIFAAIFIPLTFIAGVYGMNFENMPELTTKYGYYIIWGVFAIVGIGMLGYFKRKNWI